MVKPWFLSLSTSLFQLFLLFPFLPLIPSQGLLSTLPHACNNPFLANVSPEKVMELEEKSADWYNNLIEVVNTAVKKGSVLLLLYVLVLATT